MHDFAQALESVLAAAPVPAAEEVTLLAAPGRILAQDVAADMPLPPFDKAAMDGYACRRADLAGELTVVATLQAGEIPRVGIAEGECVKIMTGSMVPPGADCVIMVEETLPVTNDRTRFTGKETNTNICYRGEDVIAGQVLLTRGTRIAAQHIAILATCGCIRPLVAKQPRVGIIATGNELVEPGAVPGPCCIRNSNSYSLAAQVMALGITPTYYGIAADTARDLDLKIAKARAENEVLLVSGGVSMGEFDLVPDTLAANGYELLFKTVRIQPGKPTVFAKAMNSCCFGLPGNPVSTFVVFELLVKPFLYRSMGHAYSPVVFKASLDAAISRKKSERLSFYPVRLSAPGCVSPLAYHGSAHITSLCDAAGLVMLAPGRTGLEAGAIVDVRSI